MRGFIAGLCLLVACDRIVGLRELPRPDASAACSPVLPPDLDADNDGVLNDVDACPLVANHAADDEDQDGTPDACDLCPMLAEAGADPECDGIGAACDPDSTVVHDRLFIGFGSLAGLKVESSGKIENGRFVVLLDDVERTGRVVVTQRMAPAATYEVDVAVRNANVGTYWSYAIRLTGAVTHNIMLEKGSNHSLALTIKGPIGQDLASMSAGMAGSQLRFRLRVTVDSALHAEVVGEGVNAMVTAPVTLADPTIELALNAYRDANAVVAEFAAEYLVRTAVRAP